MTHEPLVYVVDSDSNDREAVKMQLAEVNLEFCAFGDAEGFLKLLEPSRLGCVLTELKVGGFTAFQLVKRLRQRTCSLPVILFTAHATVPLTVQAFKAGLFEVLEKPSEAFQLWDCAMRAFETHGQQMNETQHLNGIKSRISQLSRQEFQVMQMLLDGQPNKRIAAHLGLSPRTIVFRRKSLMEKMHARTLGELACLVHSVASEVLKSSGSEMTTLTNFQAVESLFESVGKLHSESWELARASSNTNNHNGQTTKCGDNAPV